MSRYAEKQFIAHLLDEDSLDILVKDGFRSHLIPTDELQAVYEFAVDYYLLGKLAPTEEVFDTHEVSAGRSIGDLLDDLEIEWREGPETSLDWVTKELKSTYANANAHIWMREGAQKLAESDTDSRLEVLEEIVSEGVQLTSLLQDRRTKVDVRDVLSLRMDEYEKRKRNEHVAGLTMGMPEIDEYTNMIQPGELAMFAAFAKFGKSTLLDMIALAEWERGRIPALFTIENSIDMSLDKIACISCHVDATLWQRGQCDDMDEEKVRNKIKEMENSNHPFLMFSPDPGSRNPESIVRLAQVSGADSLIIDQLSHIEYNGKQGHRPTQVMEIMNSLKTLISTGHNHIPCLLAHQINRDGKKSADKRGYYEMEDFAESSSAERWIDFGFSGYQSHDMKIMNRVLFQVLAARRAPIKWWDMYLNHQMGIANIKGEREPFSE